MTASSPPNLAELRREIDRIDDALHMLLMERGAIIDRLIAAKGTADSGIAFRPLREAEMMRRLVGGHEGRLPATTVEHLWRAIISIFTHLQAPYAVHVDGSAGFALLDEARYQVGFDVPLVHEVGAAEVVAAVAKSAGDLGLVALVPNAAPWWEGLGADAEISARLPFLVTPARPGTAAVVVTRPLGDAAVREVQVFAMSDNAKPGLAGPEILAECNAGGRWHGLLACDGCAPPKGARPVGFYARPIVLAEPAAASATAGTGAR
ncbi:MAG TPA: chorismate mutase [Hyphomicrobiales bacterium]|nr:chorismate mutase [Hyphomicrobiales bacterium]